MEKYGMWDNELQSKWVESIRKQVSYTYNFITLRNSRVFQIVIYLFIEDTEFGSTKWKSEKT